MPDRSDPLVITMDRCAWHLVWVLGLLEGVTVPLVVLLARTGGSGPKTPLHGLVVGFVGVAVVLGLINGSLRRVEIQIGDHGRLEWISPLAGAFWSGVILGLLFWFQHLLGGLLAWPYPLGHAVIGFVATAGAFLCAGWVYEIVAARVGLLSIFVRIGGRRLGMTAISVPGIALLAGMYEAVALPIIVVWTFHPSSAMAVSLVSGPLGGMAGGACICLVYNAFKARPACSFRFTPAD
jgi:hypothetical protein